MEDIIKNFRVFFYHVGLRKVYVSTEGSLGLVSLLFYSVLLKKEKYNKQNIISAPEVVRIRDRKKETSGIARS